ncbi:MAG: DegT/DnrJ/EryC1/StrS family aminotransferase [Armatimonadetes bacterium]|nr:DegT/DnrJ/EryC1/StrS family aminotransferase [Armatimonadota bacterium]
MAKLAINSGEKALNCAWPGWPIWGDEERENLNGVLESGLWCYGEKVREFEEKYAAFHGAAYGITCSSGTTALEAALLALGVGAGHEVIVPPYTFMATASAVLRVNAVPVFADIEPDTYCIDPADVERKVTDRTKAVIPVHLGGYIADMDRLWEIARKHSLWVVEDACHAWGSQWKGKGAGALGHCGVFSFQASKNINSGEGGIILTDHEDIADACRSYTNCGRVKGGAWYQHFVMGSNLRMTEFQAALLLAQLTRLEAQTVKRQESARILDDILGGAPGIRLSRPEPRMTRRSYHMYVCRIDQEALGVSRQRFLEACQAEGAPIYAGYSTPLYRNPLFDMAGSGPENCPVSCPYYGKPVDYAGVSCPVCEAVCQDSCWIPQQYLLADEQDIRALGRAICKVCENVAELR